MYKHKNLHISNADLCADCLTEDIKSAKYVDDGVINLEECYLMYDFMVRQIDLACSYYPFAVEPNIKVNNFKASFRNCFKH